MSGLGHAGSFRELVVYQRARAVTRDIFVVSKHFPREEAYSLTDQVRRSSRSVGAQITEAWAKRRYENHFISKLTDADAEQQETQHWLETAVDCSYLTPMRCAELCDQLGKIGRMLSSMMKKSKQFCTAGDFVLREETTPYFSDQSAVTGNQITED